MLSALKKGDKIITIGGIHGVISSVKENTVIVKVDDDCKIEFNRTAISTVELTDAEKAKLAEEAAAKKQKKFAFGKAKKSDEAAEPVKETAAAEETK
jgi:preprotein translocase subunit YajC